MTDQEVNFRHNVETEQETARANRANESIKADTLKETKRSNSAKERETERHNRRTERTERAKAAGQVVKDTTTGVKNISSTAHGIGNALGLLSASSNDPAWYTVDPALADQVAKINFEVPIRGSVPSMLSVKDEPKGMIMRLNYIPVLPHSLDTTRSTVSSPDIDKYQRIDSTLVNSMMVLYEIMRKNNSGGKNYEAVDFLPYIVGTSELYTWFAFGARVYGLLNQYNPKNYNQAQALINACGADYIDWLDHKDGVRAYLQTLRIKLNAFFMPNCMPYFNRKLWITLNTFKDQSSQKTQLYTFVPCIYYTRDISIAGLKANSVSLADGSQHNNSAFSMSFARYKQIVEEILWSLYNDSSTALISGDLARTFPGAEFKIEEISENYTIEPIFSQDVLDQIRNATVVGGVGSPYSGYNLDDLYGTFRTINLADTNLDAFNIRQDTAGNRLLQGPMRTAVCRVHTDRDLNETTINVFNNKGFGVDGAVISVFGDDPDTKIIFEATRLCSEYTSHMYQWGSDRTSLNIDRIIVSCNTELVLTQCLYRFNPISDDFPDHLTELIYNFDSTVADITPQMQIFLSAEHAASKDLVLFYLSEYIHQLNLLSLFSNSPNKMFYFNQFEESDENNINSEVMTCSFTDYDNFTKVSSYSLKNLNSVATISLFGVASLSKSDK